MTERAMATAHIVIKRPDNLSVFETWSLKSKSHLNDITHSLPFKALLKTPHISVGGIYT